MARSLTLLLVAAACTFAAEPASDAAETQIKAIAAAPSRPTPTVIVFHFTARTKNATVKLVAHSPASSMTAGPAPAKTPPDVADFSQASGDLWQYRPSAQGAALDRLPLE